MSRGDLNNEPFKKAALEDRVRELEQLAGQLTLENEFKESVQRGLLSVPKKSGGLLLSIVTSSKAPKWGAGSWTCPVAHTTTSRRTSLEMIHSLSNASKRSLRNSPAMVTAG